MRRRSRVRARLRCEYGWTIRRVLTSPRRARNASSLFTSSRIRCPYPWSRHWVPIRSAWSSIRPALAGLLAKAGRAQLKGVLKDQRTIAGIGNAYSDEILHAAKLSPFKPSNSLTESELGTLFAAIKGELSDAIQRADGLAAKDLKGEKKSGLRVHGRKGEKCEVCGDTIAEVSFADSALQYCPTCQTGGKKLADRRLSKLLK